MMSDFPRAILGNLIVHQKGFAFKSKDYQEVGIPVVRVSNFTDDSIDTSDLKFVSKENAQENRKVALKTNDVIIATVGSWPKNPASIVGKTICVPSKMNGALMNQNSVILRVKGECEIDQKYLFIALKTKLFSEYLVATAQGSANQASVTLSDIFSYEVEWPEPAIRKSIVSMIDSVNQKIQLNRQANQTLEQIAQAIFKSWFVDFEPTRAKIIVKQKGGNELAQELAAQALICGAITLHKLAELEDAILGIEKELHPLITKRFPNEGGVDLWQPQQLAAIAALFPNSMADSELGEVPEGWETTNVGACLKVTKGRSYKSSELEESNTALVTLKSFMRGGGYREDGLKEYTGTYKPEQVIEPGELVMSLTDVTQAAEIVGKPAIVTKNDNYERLVASLDVAILRANESSMKEFFYGLMSTYSFHRYAESYATGTTVLHLNVKGITKYEFAMPDTQLCQFYGNVAGPMLSKHERNILVSRSLGKLRDALLPKLLSGELTTTTTEKANHV